MYICFQHWKQTQYNCFSVYDCMAKGWNDSLTRQNTSAIFELYIRRICQFAHDWQMIHLCRNFPSFMPFVPSQIAWRFAFHYRPRHIFKRIVPLSIWKLLIHIHATFQLTSKLVTRNTFLHGSWFTSFSRVLSTSRVAVLPQAYTTSFPGSLILPPPGASEEGVVRWETLGTRLRPINP